MEPSPLNFVSHTHYYRGGDVVIDASAAIAPGVVFRAAPNASIRVGPGVCVGAGVVIQAKQGCVFIESGVSLGTGVLVVGHGHVGKDACVGPSTTLVNPAIAANEVVPPCSLMDGSHSPASSNRASTQSSNPSSKNQFQEQFQEKPSNFHTPDFQSPNGPVPSVPITPRTSPTVQPQAVSPKPVDVPDLDDVPSNGSNPPAENNGGGKSSAVATNNQHVYGRAHLNSLLSALFPHRQPLDNGDTGGES